MKPILKAFLLADHVYEDRATGKKIIAGTLTNLKFSEREQTVSAYAFLIITEVRSRTAFVLRYVDLDDRETLRNIEFDVSGENPLDIIEVTVRLTHLPAPHAGDYVIELLCREGIDEDLLGSHRLELIAVGGDADEGLES